MTYDIDYIIKVCIPDEEDLWLTDEKGSLGSIDEALHLKSGKEVRAVVKNVIDVIKEKFKVDTFSVYVERVQANDITYWNMQDLNRLKNILELQTSYL